MRCHELEDRLNSLLDARLPVHSDQQVAAHTAACPSCQETVLAYQLMLDGIAAVDAPQPGQAFVQRVMQTQDTSRTGRIQALYAAAVAAATAAALLLSLTVAEPENGLAGNAPIVITPEGVHLVAMKGGRQLAVFTDEVIDATEGSQYRILPYTRPVEGAWRAIRRVLPDDLPLGPRESGTSAVGLDIAHIA